MAQSRRSLCLSILKGNNDHNCWAYSMWSVSAGNQTGTVPSGRGSPQDRGRPPPPPLPRTPLAPLPGTQHTPLPAPQESLLAVGRQGCSISNFRGETQEGGAPSPAPPPAAGCLRAASVIQPAGEGPPPGRRLIAPCLRAVSRRPASRPPGWPASPPPPRPAPRWRAAPCGLPGGDAGVGAARRAPGAWESV